MTTLMTLKPGLVEGRGRIKRTVVEKDWQKRDVFLKASDSN